MEEVAGAGHIHGDAGLAAASNTSSRGWTTRLDDGLDTCVDKNLRTIGEREERVGCRNSALSAVCTISQRIRTFNGQVGGIDTIHLTHAYANRGLIMSNQNSVGLDATDGLAKRKPDP